MTATCRVDGCTDTVARKGYCSPHYTRQWRYGEAALASSGPRPKPCARCGETFQPATNRATYCSEACRSERATCERCDTEFTVTSGSSGRFCSRDCWYDTDRGSAKACPVCGSSFKGQGKTCSIGCGRTFQKANNPNRAKNCAECGVALDKPSARTRFCSRTCSMRARATHGGTRLPDGTRRPSGIGYVNIKVNGAWRAEHRVVVEGVIGRPLLPHERVHHKNGRRDDNRPENLELWRVKGKDPAGVRASDYHCPGCRCSST